MPRVVFFVLSPQTRGDRYLLACHLTERFQGEGRRLYIHAEDEGAASHIHRLLWTFRQGSFIPHDLMGAEETGLTPVIIGHRQPPSGTLDILLNLTREVPSFFQHCTEVLEPIDQDPAVREAGRARFRHYREQGLEIVTHNDFTF